MPLTMDDHAWANNPHLLPQVVSLGHARGQPCSRQAASDTQEICAVIKSKGPRRTLADGRHRRTVGLMVSLSYLRLDSL